MCIVSFGYVTKGELYNYYSRTSQPLLWNYQNNLSADTYGVFWTVKFYHQKCFAFSCLSGKRAYFFSAEIIWKAKYTVN